MDAELNSKQLPENKSSLSHEDVDDIFYSCDDVLEDHEEEMRMVDASELTQKILLSDFLYFSENSNSRKMTEFWCLVPKNELKVYVFKATREIKEERIISLEGCKVSCSNECQEQKYCLKLEAKQNIYFLATDDKKLAQNWLYVLSEGSKGKRLKEEDVKNAGSKGPVLPSPIERKTSFFNRVASIRRKK
ncbi:unnamed protein product [Clavelina lepadiformis]|uniref:PH domain-containing protein n=1 Tax=Clavelina lepadiformis TaxID=159417 RepID=A0ABP0F717_CLALP